MYSVHIVLVLLHFGGLASTDANAVAGSSDIIPVDMDDTACNTTAQGPHACSKLADEVSMMQGGMRVSRTGDLQVAVQKTMQEFASAQNNKIASLEEAFLKHAEESKQKNDQLFKRNEELSRSNEQMRKKLDQQDVKNAQLFKRNEELSWSNEQMREKLDQQETKLKQQETKHEQLRKEHRLSYGMLLQVCEKGLRGFTAASRGGANVTDVVRRSNQTFAPDVVDTVTDGVVDGANAVADATVDAANAVADAAESAYNSVADLPGDVADWTLEQLESLKSLVGLSWDDIPGLKGVINGVKDFARDLVNAATEPIDDAIDWIEGAVDEVASQVTAVKDFAVNAVNSAVDTIKDWIAALENELKKVTDYVADLYNKYLKPIITMIWECAKEAKSPIDFVVCVMKPVLEKLMDTLIPAGSVSEAIPFPFDDEALQIDPETGVYTLKQTCSDCVDGDMRDLAPLRCDKKELDFLSIFKVTAHACNVPFMPGQCGGSLLTCLKKKAKNCARGALLWGPSGVLSQLSGPVEQAMTLSQTVLDKVTYWASEARALHEKVKTFQSSSEVTLVAASCAVRTGEDAPADWVSALQTGLELHGLRANATSDEQPRRVELYQRTIQSATTAVLKRQREPVSVALILLVVIGAPLGIALVFLCFLTEEPQKRMPPRPPPSPSISTKSSVPLPVRLPPRPVFHDREDTRASGGAAAGSNLLFSNPFNRYSMADFNPNVILPSFRGGFGGSNQTAQEIVDADREVGVMSTEGEAEVGFGMTGIGARIGSGITSSWQSLRGSSQPFDLDQRRVDDLLEPMAVVQDPQGMHIRMVGSPADFQQETMLEIVRDDSQVILRVLISENATNSAVLLQTSLNRNSIAYMTTKYCVRQRGAKKIPRQERVAYIYSIDVSPDDGGLEQAIFATARPIGECDNVIGIWRGAVASGPAWYQVRTAGLSHSNIVDRRGALIATTTAQMDSSGRQNHVFALSGGVDAAMLVMAFVAAKKCS